jgi:lipopolysaccharide/colanic/teichoic acid biosynthesis glycosyltransferase
MTKRLLDLLFSSFGLILFFIPMGIIALVIRVFCRHPVIYSQERIGRHRKPFRILKFQTLVDGKPTKLGALLRKTGLDELPQFINVLRGEMSMVGPRALTLYDIERLKWDEYFYDARWLVKPGITGFAQIYGGQNKRTSWFWDRKYIEMRSPVKDIYLIFVSFMMNLLGKRRVRSMIWPNKKLK